MSDKKYCEAGSEPGNRSRDPTEPVDVDEDAGGDVSGRQNIEVDDKWTEFEKS